MVWLEHSIGASVQVAISGLHYLYLCASDQAASTRFLEFVISFSPASVRTVENTVASEYGMLFSISRNLSFMAYM